MDNRNAECADKLRELLVAAWQVAAHSPADLRGKILRGILRGILKGILRYCLTLR